MTVMTGSDPTFPNRQRESDPSSMDFIGAYMTLQRHPRRSRSYRSGSTWHLLTWRHEDGGGATSAPPFRAALLAARLPAALLPTLIRATIVSNTLPSVSLRVLPRSSGAACGVGARAADRPSVFELHWGQRAAPRCPSPRHPASPRPFLLATLPPTSLPSAILPSTNCSPPLVCSRQGRPAVGLPPTTLLSVR